MTIIIAVQPNGDRTLSDLEDEIIVFCEVIDRHSGKVVYNRLPYGLDSGQGVVIPVKV